jgi:serine/threonine protein kinase
LQLLDAFAAKMSYCLNPSCPKPQNPDGAKFCQSCGSKLMLKNRYRAARPLGQGGFGSTFLAVDEKNGNKCVIKKMLAHHQENAKVKELFEREGKQLAELGSHPQIPALLDYFEQGLEKAGEPANAPGEKYLYLVQQFIEGQTLLEELLAQGSFSEAQIKEVLKDLLPVLKFIHERQAIHRDIKPENIIRRQSDRQLVLIDFGAVKEFTATSIGQTGTKIHTPGYAANEQIRGKAYPASDLYSLGATCVHLLTGALPDNMYDVLEDRLLWRELLAQKKIKISNHLAQVLDKMLKSLARDRYQSADEVLKEFCPEVKLSHSRLELAATKPGEIVISTIKITNAIPDTFLEVKLDVAAHPNDPPHLPSNHTWITFQPQNFKGNSGNVKIQVNTSNLVPDRVYEREILLLTNSQPENHSLKIQVKTAPIKIDTPKIPMGFILSLLFVCGALSYSSISLITSSIGVPRNLDLNLLYWGGIAGGIAAPLLICKPLVSLISVIGSKAGFNLGGLITNYLLEQIGICNIEFSSKCANYQILGSIIGSAIGFMAGVGIFGGYKTIFVAIFGAVFGIISGVFVNTIGSFDGSIKLWLAVIGGVLLAPIAIFIGNWIESKRLEMLQQGFREIPALTIILISICFGMSLGGLFWYKDANQLVIWLAIASGFPLAISLLYLPWQKARLLAKYYHAQQNLIQP